MIERISDSRKRQDAGFTLIELLVTIIILGILSAVVVFAVQGSGDKGLRAAVTTDKRIITTAQEAFCAQNGHYARDTEELAQKGFLSEKSTYHKIVTQDVTGACTGNPAGPSGYKIECLNADCTAAGGGGVTPPPVGGAVEVAGGDTVSGNAFVNPASTTSGPAHTNTEYMFNGLLRWNESNTAEPDLADVNVSADQQTATFTLRDVKFHDGTPLEAEDVDFTFRNALIKYHGRTQGSIVPAFGGTVDGANTTIPAGAITFPDPDGSGPLTGGSNGRGVQFNFVAPYAPLLRQLNVTEAPILPKHIYETCANISTSAGCAANNPPAVPDLIAANASRHIGTGPFMLKQRDTTAQTITLVKNPNYHRPGLPLADEVRQKPYANTAAAADALEAGQVDVALVAGDRLPPKTGAGILLEPDFLTAAVPRGTGGGNCVLTWGFNLWQKGKTPAEIKTDIANNPSKRGDHPIFGDATLVDPDGPAGPEPFQPRGQVVRKAITMALNRPLLFDNIEFGKGRVADSAYHSKLTGAYAPQNMLPFDQTTADLWLTAAGWTGNPRQSTGLSGMPTAGTPLTFDSHGFSTGTQAKYFDQIKNQLAAVGIAITSIATATGPGADGMFGTRAYDSMFFSMCQGDDPVIGARRSIHSSQISATAFTNMSGYYNPTVDILWDTAFGANYTSNHGQIQSTVVSEAPMVWISETLNTRAWRSGCSGFNNQNTGLYVETAACSG